ncbi:hypothetical protein E3N88_23396 [Mikania micrantha]|uniref:DUF4218 domain-containing protein n=1 Tax=Mikania micrantha TaxID=192012 RepID=A0A5N6NFR4_9ASTR|nr:hypothetical protein E3N88_23396 [Mikania micrantha]
MVHLVLHLPEEAILGGPVYMRWMYPFERYMKKLKAYVRNKARPEGSIAEGYVADEALTFCSMYLEGMQTKFNRPDRNADAGIPKRQLHVFSSQCRPISKKKIISLSDETRKSLEWFVLNNCDEIKDHKSYKSNTSSFISSSDELKALAHGPLNAYLYTACIVNGVRFVVHNRDVRRTTQNSGVVTIGEDKTPFYGQLEEIIEMNYLHGYSVVLFRCKWFNTSGKRLIKKNNITVIDVSREWFVNEQYILATQAKQVFYLQDPSRTTGNWRVVEDVHHRKLWDHPSMSVVNEIDILHDTQSSDYNLVVDDDLRDNESFECNLVVDLGFLPMRTTSEESMRDEILIDDDDEEEEDENVYFSDDEDEINDDVDNEDDDDIEDTQYYRMADVARSHGGDGGNEPPYGPPYNLRTGCESSKPAKKRSHGKNLNLYEKFQRNGSRPLPLENDYSSNQFRAVGENYQLFVRLVSNEVDKHAPFHYRSWQEVPGEIKMSILTTLHHYFDLQRYHNTEYWEGIKQGIQSDCANRYKDRKTKLKKHFDKVGGYDNTERAKTKPPEGMNPVQETGVPKHVEGWREMHCKGSSGWYNEMAETHWVSACLV